MIFTTLAMTNPDLARVCSQQNASITIIARFVPSLLNSGGILLNVVFFVHGPNRPISALMHLKAAFSRSLYDPFDP